MKISSNFDSGAILAVGLGRLQEGWLTQDLAFRPDSHADYRQWFHFRLQGVAGVPCRLRLLDAASCTFPDGWPGYQAVASYDRKSWFRVPTRYDGQVLTIEHTPERDSIYYAYFEPYSQERHLDLLGWVDSSPLARVSDLGSTVDGRDLNLVTVGSPGPGKGRIWVIARQHPGETMAEWFVEGMLRRLLDDSDATARRLLEQAVFYVVPNINPDGAYRGNLRSNGAGVNLNRAWLDPSMTSSPEVFLVRQKIAQTGVDVFLDVHGDESLPWVFLAGCEMLPDFSFDQAARQRVFSDEFKRASPDFQDVHGYAADKYHADALSLASKYIGHTYGCLSLTLEMPFKDNADLPQAQTGWSSTRSLALGAAVLQPMLAAVRLMV